MAFFAITAGIFFLQVAVMFWLEFKDRSLFFLIWPVFAVFTLIPMFWDFITIAGVHRQTVIVEALSIAIAFNFSYMVSYLLVRSRKDISGWYAQATYSGSSLLRNSHYISIILFIISIAVFYFGGGGADAIMSSSWRDKGELGVYALLILYITSLLSGLLCKSLDDRKFLVAGVTVLFIAAIVVIFRTRALIAMCVLSLAIYFIYIRRMSLLWLIPIAVALIGFSILLRAARFMGALNQITLEGVIRGSTDSLRTMFTQGDLSIYQVYLQIVENCEVAIPCFEFTNLQSLLGYFGADRVQRFEYVLYDRLVQSGVGGSLHPTAYGIAFGDFGIIGGAILFALLPVLHRVLNLYASRGRFYLMIGFIAPYLIFLPRGSIYNSMTLLVVGVFVSQLLGPRMVAPSPAISRGSRSYDVTS